MNNKAVFLTQLETLEMREIPVPELKSGEVLVRLEAVGICGSDIHYYQHGSIGDFKVSFPFILGHECAGVIVETAPDVTDRKKGDRVALEPGIPCGACEFCLSGKYNLCPDVKFLATPPYDGCLMNYIAYPASWTFPIPDHMSMVEGALVEPLAIGINACVTGGVTLGDDVVIFGAGCIGLVTLLAAKAYGASRVIVIDVLDKRLELAKSLGATVINGNNCDVVDEIMSLTGEKGARVVIDCAGTNATLTATVRCAKSGGMIVLVGMAANEINGLPLAPISVKELTITSIFRYRNLYPTTISAIADGKIDVNGIVSDRYQFEDCVRAYAETLANAKDIVKSVILFS